MSNNKQYLRTDRDIQNALSTLLEKIPFEKITVCDIITEAMISRNTFYAHYHDKYEIIEKIFEDFSKKYDVFSQTTFVNPEAKAFKESAQDRIMPIINNDFIDFAADNAPTIKILRLANIPGYNTDDLFRSYYSSIYRNDSYNKGKSKTQLDIETEMISAIILSFTKSYSVNLSDENPLISTSQQEAITNVMLYLLGIRYSKYKDQAVKLLEEIRINCRKDQEEYLKTEHS